MLLSNIVNDLFFNAEMRDSLMAQNKRLKIKSTQVIEDCDSIKQHMNQRDNIKNGIILTQSIQIKNLNSKLNKKTIFGNIKTGAIVVLAIFIAIIL